MTANTVRQDIIAMLLEAKTGHSAGPLGMADVFTVCTLMPLSIIRRDRIGERDKIVLSNGHIVPSFMRRWRRAGYFPAGRIKNLAKIRFKPAGASAQIDAAKVGNEFRTARFRLVASGRHNRRFSFR